MSWSTTRPATEAISTSLLARSGAAERWTEEHASQGLGKPLTTLTGLVDGGDQLLGEERIAVGPAGDRIDQRLRRRPARDGRQQLDELVALETPDVDPLDTRLTFGLGQPARQRMPAVELIGAEGPDDQEAFVASVSGEEREQVSGRAIGPVEVFDDQHDGRTLAQATKEPQDPFEDAGLEPFDLLPGPRIIAGDDRQLRDEPGQLGECRSRSQGDTAWVDIADQGAERLDDRAEREPVVSDGDGPALEDQPVAIAQTGRGLGDETGLADPRLTADEDQRGSPGRGDVGRLDERLELVRASDEDRAGKPPSHARNDRAERRPSFPSRGTTLVLGLCAGRAAQPGVPAARGSEMDGRRC